MSNGTIIETEGEAITRAWKPTGALRWHVPNRTTIRAPVLQQEWREHFSGDIRWRSIPVYVSDEYSEAPE